MQHLKLADWENRSWPCRRRSRIALHRIRLLVSPPSHWTCTTSSGIAQRIHFEGVWWKREAIFLYSPVYRTGRHSILSTRDLGVHSSYVSRSVRNPASILPTVNLRWCPLDNEIASTSVLAAWHSTRSQVKTHEVDTGPFALLKIGGHNSIRRLSDWTCPLQLHEMLTE